ncbi:hypothetical protein EVAR_100721_1 [Eumeta japonica]|uniref:Uncharacterized protein n=1 Tax=Eumeta variegata TaxID=151549 RepID=A0A4C1ZUI7_EUMVA|nr:hypothetical protein EVAR_100721_1 [Eumeta japonica]
MWECTSQQWGEKNLAYRYVVLFYTDFIEIDIVAGSRIGIERGTRNRFENGIRIRIKSGCGSEIDNGSTVDDECRDRVRVKSTTRIGIDRHKEEGIHSMFILAKLRTLIIWVNHPQERAKQRLPG